MGKYRDRQATWRGSIAGRSGGDTGGIGDNQN